MKILSENDKVFNASLPSTIDRASKSLSDLTRLSFQHLQANQTPIKPLCQKNMDEDPLELPLRHKKALGLSLISCLSYFLSESSYQNVSSLVKAGQMSESLWNFTQNPSLSALVPFGIYGAYEALQSALPASARPFAHLCMQGLYNYELCVDAMQRISVTLKHTNASNLPVAARNLFVYGFNTLWALNQTYTSAQGACIRSDPKLKQAKDILCEHLETCPTQWSKQEVKQLYRRQSLHLHPDKNPHASLDAFERLTQAKDYLLKNLSDSDSTSKSIQGSWNDVFSQLIQKIDQYFRIPTATASQESRQITLGPVDQSVEAGRQFSSALSTLILGDSFVGVSDRISDKYVAPIEFLDKLSENLPPHLESLAPQLKKLVGSVAYAKDDPAVTARRVRDLPVGQSLVLEAGFSMPYSKANHRLYCEFLRKDQRHYDIYIYNVGGGASYHNLFYRTPYVSKDPEIRMAHTPTKAYLEPFVFFESVDSRRIGIDRNKGSVDLSLFEKLHDLYKGRYEKFGFKDLASSFYLDLFGHLNDHKRPILIDVDDYWLTRPQISGTCQWLSVPRALLRRWIHDPLDYENLLFHFELPSLYRMCQGEVLSWNAATRKFCFLAAKSVLQRLIHFEKSIASQELDEHSSAIGEILHNTKQAKSSSITLGGNVQMSTISPKLHPPSMKIQPSSDRLLVSSLEKVFAPATFSPSAPVFSSLSSWIDLSEKILAKEPYEPQTGHGPKRVYVDSLFEIERFVEMLPELNAFKDLCGNEPTPVLQKALDAAGAILERYSQLMYYGVSSSYSALSMRNKVTLFDLLAAMDIITKRLFPELESYSIAAYRLFETGSTSVFSYSLKEIQRLKALFDYFKRSESSKELFDFFALRDFQLTDQTPEFPEEKLYQMILRRSKESSTMAEQMLNESRNKTEFLVGDLVRKRALLLLHSDWLGSHPLGALKRACFLAFGGLSVRLNAVSPHKVTFEDELKLAIDTFQSFFLIKDSYDPLNSLDLRKERENSLLVDPNRFRDDQYDIATVSCDKSLQCTKLISLYSQKENLLKLTDPSHQKLFHKILFQAYFSSESQELKVPLLEALDRPDFQEQISLWLARSLEFFGREGPEFNLETAAFFAQIAAELRGLKPDLVLPDFLKALDSWLELMEGDFARKERVHWTRVAFLAPLFSQSSPPTSETVEKLLSSWIACGPNLLMQRAEERQFYSYETKPEAQQKNVRSESANRLGFFQPGKIAQDHIYKLSSYLSQVSEDQVRSALRLSFPSFDFELRDAQFVPVKGHPWRWRSKDHLWDIDLLRADLSRAGKPIYSKEYAFSSFETHPLFHRLFKEVDIQLNAKSPDEVFFSAANGCLFHLNLKESRLQVTFDGKSYQYLEQGFDFLLKDSERLLAFQAEDREVVFLDPHDFSLCYRLCPKGAFQDVKGQSVFVAQDLVLPDELASIEEKEAVIATKLATGEIEIKVPRFAAASGRAVTFNAGQGVVRYLEDPLYVVKKRPENLLEPFRHFFVLEHKEAGKKKVLIPGQKLAKSRNFSPHAFPEINQGPCRVYEYDLLDSGEMISSSPESALYLAYLYTALEQYEKATDIFDNSAHLKKHEVLSETAAKIIIDFLALPFAFPDSSHPEPAALALKASLFLLRNERLQNNESLDVDARKWLLLAAYTYENSLDSVPATLRLSPKQKKELEALIVQTRAELITPNAHAKGRVAPPLRYDLSINALSRGYVFDSLTPGKGDTSGLDPIYELPPSSFDDLYREFRWDFMRKKNHRILTFPMRWELYNLDNEYSNLFTLNPKHFIGLDLKTLEPAYEEFKGVESIEDLAFLRMKYKEIFDEYHSNDFLRVLTGLSSNIGRLPPLESLGNVTEAKQWLNHFSVICTLPLTPHIPPTQKSKFQSITRPPRPLFQSMPEALETFKESDSRENKFPLTLSSPQGSLWDTDFLRFFTLRPAVEESQSPSLWLECGPADPIYGASVEQEQNLLAKDYSFFLAQSKSVGSYALKPTETLSSVQDTLQKTVDRLEKKRRSFESTMLSLANAPPTDLRQARLGALLAGAEITASPSKQALISAFLAGTSESYLSLNPHLSASQLRSLDEATLRYLETTSALRCAQKALKEEDPMGVADTLVASELSHLWPEDLRRLFLVFEYRSGLRLQRKQIDLLSQLKQKGAKPSINQLMMGGGKTSVLAVHIMYLAAAEGFLPFFVVSASQFDTLTHRFGSLTQQYFSQDLVPLQFSRGELTKENLLWMVEQLQSSIENKDVFLTTKETLESIELEFLALLFKNSIDVEDEDRLGLLSTILLHMKQKGYALGDEIDLLMTPLHETNFPLKAKVPVDESLIGLVEKVFTALQSKEINALLSLRENLQASLDPKERKEVLKRASSLFFDKHCHLLGMQPEQKQKFISYVFSSESSEDQSIDFSSLDKARQEVFLLRHLFSDVLPLTLSKSAHQHYGRVPKPQRDDEVGPYGGVDSPTFTEFASPWEAICYHFQTALAKGLTRKQVQSYVRQLKEQAQFKGQPFESTEESRFFHELTGQPLKASYSPSTWDHIQDQIEKRPTLVLQIERQSLSSIVGSYVEYLSAGPQSLFDQMAVFLGMSGTPWNAHTYPKAMQQTQHLDAGIEGKIVHTFLQRAKKTPGTIHSVEGSNVKTLLTTLTSVMAAERRNRLYGMIDTGGLFRNAPSRLVAQEMLRFFSLEKRIQSVVYFGRREPGGPVTLMALKKGSPEPIVLGSTDTKEIARLGIDLKKAFIYYDESHCEATDLLQRKDAINALTLDHTMNRRTLFQGMLRLRQYFQGQDLEFLVPASQISHFSKVPGSLPTHEQILAKTQENQGAQKAEEGLRSFKQKLAHVPRQIAMEQILNLSSYQGQKHMFERYKTFFVQTQSTSLETMGSKSPSWRPTLEKLQSIASAIKQRFEQVESRSRLRAMFTSRMQEVLDEAKKAIFLPSFSKEEEIASNLEFHVQTVRESEVDLELSQQKHKQVQRSIHQGNLVPYKEIPWEESDIPASLAPISYQESAAPFSFSKFLGWGALSERPQVYPVNEILPLNLKGLFSPDFCASKNFMHTAKKFYSVFHKATQKLAEQVLLHREKNTIRAILLSSLEAGFFKQYIENNHPSNLWLVVPSGHSYTHFNAPMDSRDEEKKVQLLAEVNLFKGNVESILSQAKASEHMQSLPFEKLYDFLQKKIVDAPIQKNLFERLLRPLLQPAF